MVVVDVTFTYFCCYNDSAFDVVASHITCDSFSVVATSIVVAYFVASSLLKLLFLLMLVLNFATVIVEIYVISNNVVDVDVFVLLLYLL